MNPRDRVSILQAMSMLQALLLSDRVHDENSATPLIISMAEMEMEDESAL